MSQWETAFEQGQLLPRVTESLRVLQGSSTTGLGPDDIAGLARIQKVLILLEGSLSSADVELFNPGIWGGNLSSASVNMQNYLTAFSNDKNPANLQHANSMLNEIVSVLHPYGLVTYGDSSKSLLKASQEFKKTLVAELEQTRAQSAEIAATFNLLTNEVTQLKASITASSQVIEQQKSRIDQSIAEFQKQHSASEAARAAEFSSSVQKSVADFATLTKSSSDAFDEEQKNRDNSFNVSTDDFEVKSKKILDFFLSRQKEVDKIFGAIGAASFAGHFNQTATNDGSAANWLRGGALVLMCGMVAVAAFSFWQSLTDQQHDWRIFLFRLATVFVIAIPAVYAAQESSKHREKERRNRKIYLELSAIDAYLVQLPEAKRHELREKLTEKFFGVPEVQPEDKDSMGHAAMDILKDAVKNLTKDR